MSIDERAMTIADAAVEGYCPSENDLEYLLQFDGYSPEAAYVEVQARRIAFQASKGQATIHAQIGVDAHPCPENCQYCAFACVNSDAASGEAPGETSFELPMDEVVKYAQIFDELNVHLISLMSTAGMPFSRYLDMVRAVRAAVSPDMPILANTRDLTVGEARALKEAGANAAYHAVRIGEGRYTDIDPARRKQTIENIHAAGLALMSGIEPVWEGCSVPELCQRLLDLRDFQPYCTGACGLSSVEGTVLAGKGMKTPRTGFVRYIGALSRLVCGYDVRFGGVGGSVWVDAGCDPRKRGVGYERTMLERDVHKARRQLSKDGWTVPLRADMQWFA